MKVLLCSPLDDGQSIHSGGIALWTKNLKLYYDSIGKDSSVDLKVLPCNRSYYTNLSDSFLSRFWGGLKDYLKVLRKLNTVLKKEHFDIVHICTSASLGLLRDWLFLNSIKRHNSQGVIHFRFGRIPELCKSRNWEWLLLDRVLRSATKSIVIDRDSLQSLIYAGYTNVEYIPNPLQEKTLELVSSYESIRRISRTVLFVGHVIPSKGVYELVEAVKDMDNIRLIIAGSVEEEVKDYLLELAGPESEKWLTLLGYVSYEETIKQMLSCDVFALPSYTEGFPNVILEAMACRCAIVATDVGAIPELLEEENGQHYGILVKPKSAGGLQSAINRFLEDDSFKKACGENARVRVIERYSMNYIWRKMVDVWSEVIR